MKKTIIIALCLAIVASFVSCGTKVADNSVAGDFSFATPETLEEKYYYAMGYIIAGNYGYYYQDLDYDMYVSGAYGYAKGTSPYTVDELYGFVEEYENQLSAELAETAAKNLEAAEKFLEKNGKKDGVVTTSSGLQYKVTTTGTGAMATLADTVVVDYKLSLEDGTVVDQGTDVAFSLSSLIDGVAEACTVAPMGSSLTVWVHPDLGYGADGASTIEPNTLLIFELTLKSIN